MGGNDAYGATVIAILALAQELVVSPWSG